MEADDSKTEVENHVAVPVAGLLQNLEADISMDSQSEEEIRDTEHVDTIPVTGLKNKGNGFDMNAADAYSKSGVNSERNANAEYWENDVQERNKDKIIDPEMDLQEAATKILLYTRNKNNKLIDVVNMEAPIALVVKTKGGKMKVNEKAAEILSSCLAPVSVISIVGKYRTGKSYLMNRFFDSNYGFDLGATIESTTKGIWMWIKPHPLHKNTALILLDFEGMGDVEKGDKEDDMGLFSLALLLSKVMIYNIKGVIDNDMIHEIDFVSYLTEKIKISESEEEEGGEEFMMNFPRLCFVLRDFELELRVKDNDITPTEYLENALRLKTGFTTKISEYNRPRQCVKNYFPKRGCYTLCRPVEDSTLLKQMDTVPESKLKQEFILQVRAMTKEMLMFAEPLLVGSNVSQFTGRRFLGLINTYTNSINNGSVPCVGSAMSHLMKQEFEHACDQACEVYKQVFSSLINPQVASDQEMSDHHQQAQREALVVYQKLAFLEDREQIEKKNQILEKLKTIYVKYQHLNEEKSEQLCQKLIIECFTARSEDVLRNAYGCPGGYDMYQKETERAILKYERTPNQGPMASSVLKQYMEEHEKEKRMIINMDKLLGEKEKEFEQKKLLLELEAYRKELEIQSLRKRDAEMKQQHDAMRFLLDENKKELEEKKVQQEKMLQELKDVFHNMGKEQMEEIKLQIQEKDENLKVQHHEHYMQMEKMKQEQQQQLLKFEAEIKQVQQEKKEQHLLVNNLKETLQVTTNMATEEQNKRRLQEKHLQQLEEDYKKQLQKQEQMDDEAEALQHKLQIESEKQMEKIQQHYNQQLNKQEEEINRLRQISTKQGIKQSLAEAATLKSLLDAIAGVPGYSFLQTDYKTVEKPSDQMKIIQPMTHSKEGYMLSAAINIGRSYFGFAFSFRTNPERIQMKRFYSSSLQEIYTSYTTISSILVDLQDNLISFGWDAEQRYVEVVAADQHHKYALYRLNDDLDTSEKLTKGCTITSTDGRTADAFKIYSIALKSMKDNLIETITQEIDSSIEEFIRWVITVPSSWSDEAKQLFRVPNTDDNIVVSEEEAILSLIQEQDECSYQFQPKALFTDQIGLKLLVINAGDRTTDFTVLRILPSENIEQLHFSSGGPWGSEHVTKEFMKIIILIFGQHWMSKNHPAWLKLLKSIHVQLRNVKISMENASFRLQIGLGFDLQLLENAVNELKEKDISVKDGTLIFTEKALLALFQPLLGNIRKHLAGILDQVQGIDTVILAGSFGNSTIVQNCIKECMPGNVSMVVPLQPELAFIKGAVYYGHQSGQK